MKSQTISKTYKEVAEDYIASSEKEMAERLVESAVRSDNNGLGFIKDQIRGFAAYLDSFPTMSSQLEILALYKTREIDREFIAALIEGIGVDKATEIARSITGRHKHSKPEAREEAAA